MLLTEEEAGTKWCPFARTVEVDDRGPTNARNRVVQIEGNNGALLAQQLVGCKCIGSACMAWRLGTKMVARNRATGVCRDLKPGDTYSASEDLSYDVVDPEHGFCGLAGRPS